MIKQSKAISRIDDKISAMEENSLRRQILLCAKSFKTAWVDLGRYLVGVYKDKQYKEWGYLTFEAYCSKEIGIRKETAVKLLRSYYFLEKEEPDYLKKDYLESVTPDKFPSYESVHTLSQAKNNKNISIEDYNRIKQQIFEDGKAEKDIKDAYRAITKTLEEEAPEEVREKKRLNYVRRMVGVLNSLKKEIEINKFLPGKLVSELGKIIAQIEGELK